MTIFQTWKERLRECESWAIESWGAVQSIRERLAALESAVKPEPVARIAELTQRADANQAAADKWNAAHEVRLVACDICRKPILIGESQFNDSHETCFLRASLNKLRLCVLSDAPFLSWNEMNDRAAQHRAAADTLENLRKGGEAQMNGHPMFLSAGANSYSESLARCDALVAKAAELERERDFLWRDRKEKVERLEREKADLECELMNERKLVTKWSVEAVRLEREKAELERRLADATAGGWWMTTDELAELRRHAGMWNAWLNCAEHRNLSAFWEWKRDFDNTRR